ncbi:MAG: SGNH hydrolase domain-containing protein [Candidatus Nanopelagicales bacterium]
MKGKSVIAAALTVAAVSVSAPAIAVTTDAASTPRAESVALAPKDRAHSILSPRRLHPSPSQAKGAEPPIYSNGCHSWPPRTAAKACVYGAKKSTKTVMLFGDSHAAHWFGGVRDIADQNRYRMLSVTKSSCPAADLRVRRYRAKQVHTSCFPWRQNVFRKLKAQSWGDINVAVVSSWHFHQVLGKRKLLRGPARDAEWRRAIDRTLSLLSASVDQVILLRDSPQMPRGMNGYWRCIAKNQARPKRCGTATSKALPGGIWRIEKASAATFPNVKSVDLSTQFCGGSFCSPADGKLLAFKDDNHWNQVYVRARLGPKLAPHVTAAMQLRD